MNEIDISPLESLWGKKPKQAEEREAASEKNVKIIFRSVFNFYEKHAEQPRKDWERIAHEMQELSRKLNCQYANDLLIAAFEELERQDKAQP